MRITYRDRSSYKQQVAAAVTSWNAAGTPFTLAPVKAGKRADITIVQRTRLRKAGRIVAGLGGHGAVSLSTSALGPPNEYSNQQVRVVAHELGHALGLLHSARACAVMFSYVEFPSANDECKKQGVRWDGLQPCGPRTADVNALAKLWRFRPKNVANRGFCPGPVDPAKAATHGLMAGVLSGAPDQVLNGPDESSDSISLTLTNTGTITPDEGDFGVVFVDGAGAIIPDSLGYGSDYYGFEQTPAPGESTPLTVPVCDKWGWPQVVRLRLASQGFDALLGPVLTFNLSLYIGQAIPPSGACT